MNKKDADLFRRIDEVLTGHELQRTTEFAMSVPVDSPPDDRDDRRRIRDLMTAQIQACLVVTIVCTCGERFEMADLLAWATHYATVPVGGREHRWVAEFLLRQEPR